MRCVATRSARGHRLGPRRRLRPGAPARRRRSRSTSATTRPTCRRRRRRGRATRPRSPADNPERAAARERGLPELPARRPARRAERAAAHDRGRRHARQDDDGVAWRRTRCAARAGPGLPRRRRAALDRARTPTGAPGSGSWSRPTSRTARCSRCTSTSPCVTNVELDHHATFGSLARGRATCSARSSRPRRRPSSGTARTSRPARRRPGRRPSTCRDPSSTPAARASPGAGSEVALGVPGRPQRAQRRRRAGGLPARRRRPGAGRCRAGRLRGRRAPLPARSGDRAQRRARRRRLRPPPDRGARRRSRPPARWRRAASSRSSSPTCTRAPQRLAREFGAALARADVAAVLDVYPARERAEDFPGVSGLLVAEAAADAAGGRTVPVAADVRRRRAGAARLAARRRPVPGAGRGGRRRARGAGWWAERPGATAARRARASAYGVGIATDGRVDVLVVGHRGVRRRGRAQARRLGHLARRVAAHEQLRIARVHPHRMGHVAGAQPAVVAEEVAPELRWAAASTPSSRASSRSRSRCACRTG